jgi:threonine dehydratase
MTTPTPTPPETPALPALADIRAAQARLAGRAVVTPLLESDALNRLIGGRLLVKPECLQVTGSFKFRGAFNRIAQLDGAARRAGVVAFSSGNHAQGVAAAARYAGAPAVIVMPDDAPQVKRRGTESWGCEIVTYDRHDHDSRERIAAGIVAERGGTLVKPYDDFDVIAGQGTVGAELVEQARGRGAAVDAVLVPCGGGGLTAGVATAVAGLEPAATVWSVEPEGFDDHARSYLSGRRENIRDGADSFCDALLAPRPGELTFAITSRLVRGGLAVSDEEVAEAMRLAFTHLKIVVEPGGAVALAAVLSGRLETRNRTLVAVCSGGNVDDAAFARILNGG